MRQLYGLTIRSVSQDELDLDRGGRGVGFVGMGEVVVKKMAVRVSMRRDYFDVRTGECVELTKRALVPSWRSGLGEVGFRLFSLYRDV